MVLCSATRAAGLEAAAAANDIGQRLLDLSPMLRWLVSSDSIGSFQVIVAAAVGPPFPSRLLVSDGPSEMWAAHYEI